MVIVLSGNDDQIVSRVAAWILPNFRIWGEH
jgi:hypothetical protein